MNDLRVLNIDLNKIKDNPYQPRKRYSKMGLRALADNIYARGLMQPVSVVEIENADNYILVAGHRRLRAFKLLRQKTIPAIVRMKSTKEDMVLDLAVENALRKDFNPIEKAQAIFHVLCTLEVVNNNPVYAYSLVGQLKSWETRGKAPCTKGICANFTDDDVFECRRLLKLIDISGSSAQQYLRLMDLPNRLKSFVITTKNQVEAERLMHSGYITVKQAYELTRIRDNKLRVKIYEKMIAEGWRYISLKHIIDELLEKGVGMNRHSGLGTCKSKLNKENKLMTLSQSCFRLSSRLHNSKNMISRMAYSLDKAAIRASLNKLKGECIRLAEECSNTLKTDDGLELINADLEFTIRKAKEGSRCERRMQCPIKLTKTLHLNPGDKLSMKVIGVVRTTPLEDSQEDDVFEDTLAELLE